MSNINLYIDDRIIKTKELLKQALISLLSEKSFNDISITNIARRADLNRGTFYNHYKSTEALLKELVDEIVSDFIVAFRKPYQSDRQFNVNDLLPSDIELFDTVYLNANTYIAIVHSTIFSKFEAQLLSEVKNLYIKDLRVYNPKVNSEWIAKYFAYGIVGMVLEWIQDGFKYSTHFMNEQLLELIKIAPKQTFRTTSYMYKNGFYNI